MKLIGFVLNLAITIQSVFTMESTGSTAANLKRLTLLQRFCGDRLSEVMSTYCQIYYAPQRYRRQIADDCCHKRCSYTYIFVNYCKKIDNAAIKRDLTFGEDVDDVTLQNLTEAQSMQLQIAGTNERRKRNCNCSKTAKRKRNKISQAWQDYNFTTRPELPLGTD